MTLKAKIDKIQFRRAKIKKKSWPKKLKWYPIKDIVLTNSQSDLKINSFRAQLPH